MTCDEMDVIVVGFTVVTRHNKLVKFGRGDIPEICRPLVRCQRMAGTIFNTKREALNRLDRLYTRWPDFCKYRHPLTVRTLTLCPE